jgi:hypothetical protein
MTQQAPEPVDAAALIQELRSQVSDLSFQLAVARAQLRSRAAATATPDPSGVASAE